MLFADPFTRELIVDWDIHARQALAEFRSATSAVRHDPAMVELVDMLSARARSSPGGGRSTTSPVSRRRLRRFNHPTPACSRSSTNSSTPPNGPSLRVVAQLPVPGDDSAERLAVRHYLV